METIISFQRIPYSIINTDWKVIFQFFTYVSFQHFPYFSNYTEWNALFKLLKTEWNGLTKMRKQFKKSIPFRMIAKMRKPFQK